MTYDKLIFELSSEGRNAYSLPKLSEEEKTYANQISSKYLSTTQNKFPEVSEVDVVRHYTNLSKLNYGVDDGFYPLGSCTMKYNPKINEDMASLDGFVNQHPLQDESTIQGSLQMMYELQQMLSEISGMDYATLQPAAGAHGEFVGLLLIKKYHEIRGDIKRTKIIVPDSSHGTNPSSAFVAGLEIVEVKSDELGNVDMDSLKSVLSDEIAGLMLTNPSTLGLFEPNIKEIADLVHNAGGLLYYDGANMNAILGKCRPADMGFDVMHYNVHKTFSTPHGGGGPGAGPVCVKEFLKDYLPTPRVDKLGDKYVLNYNLENSIGRVKSFYGNFAVLLKTYVYIKTMGYDGLNDASSKAVLNANYIKEKLKSEYILPIDRVCKHEFVLSGFDKMHDMGLSTLDIAKRMLDYGVHPPTIYFPLIIKEAIMIEPTETESVQTLDNFIDIMKSIKREAIENSELLKTAPHNTAIGRVDEVKAAKDLKLTYWT